MTAARLAIVTGGTRGIGRAVSLRLAREGWGVRAVYARDREAARALEAEAAAAGVDLRALRADLTDPERVRSCAEELLRDGGRIDALVHSAASGVHRPVGELTPRHLAWTMAVNVFGFHALLRELLPHMGAGARLVGITSLGATRASSRYAAVGASKGALDALFRHYARELAPRGIGVNLVCPGLVLTGALEAFPDKDARIAAALERTPSGRLTTPDDVAGAVAFLCGPDAAQIVGATLVVDGGRSLIMAD